jgi:hypothetical protein
MSQADNDGLSLADRVRRFEDVHPEAMPEVIKALELAEDLELAYILPDWEQHVFCCHYPAPLRTPDALACGMIEEVKPDNPFKALRGEV